MADATTIVLFDVVKIHVILLTIYHYFIWHNEKLALLKKSYTPCIYLLLFFKHMDCKISKIQLFHQIFFIITRSYLLSKVRIPDNFRQYNHIVRNMQWFHQMETQWTHFNHTCLNIKIRNKKAVTYFKNFKSKNFIIPNNNKI